MCCRARWNDWHSCCPGKNINCCRCVDSILVVCVHALSPKWCVSWSTHVVRNKFGNYVSNAFWMWETVSWSDDLRLVCRWFFRTVCSQDVSKWICMHYCNWFFCPMKVRKIRLLAWNTLSFCIVLEHESDTGKEVCSVDWQCSFVVISWVNSMPPVLCNVLIYSRADNGDHSQHFFPFRWCVGEKRHPRCVSHSVLTVSKSIKTLALPIKLKIILCSRITFFMCLV